MQVKLERLGATKTETCSWHFDHIKATIQRSESAPDVVFFCGPENLAAGGAAASVRLPASPQLNTGQFAATFWTRGGRFSACTGGGDLQLELHGADGKRCTAEVRPAVRQVGTGQVGAVSRCTRHLIERMLLSAFADHDWISKSTCVPGTRWTA